jgi:hypothetical protein
VRSRPTLDEIAERYVRLTLKLAQHQPSLVEIWLGPDDWRPGPRRPVAEIREEIFAAYAALAESTPPSGQNDRCRYLQGQLKALQVAVRRLAGESMRFLDEADAVLGVGNLNALEDGAAIESARAELGRRLPGRGPLHERHAAFRARHALSSGHIMPCFRAAVAACRDRVGRHVPLPETENVEVTTATDAAAEARAIYQGGFRTRVTIDSRGRTDLARLVWLAAHEAYPGHHVQHLLADRDHVEARGWRERALHPAFGNHLFCSEGAAEAGAALVLEGGAFEEICRELARMAGASSGTVSDLVAVHRAVMVVEAVIPPIAQAYLDGEIGSDAAADRLSSDALVADARRFLAVIERQRTRLLGYPLGRRIVSAEVFAVPPAERWRRLMAVATTLTTSRPL